ncbi:putative ABC amino acid transporter, substrate-binding protein [Clostridium neonatale]|uniref:amino acid ABC transporter substrate-binding protein n=1 Tax=Clostridium neonatale TaxID=137838 RepID=UPI00291BDBEB|nr:putative ABC amino acid transporter, substrate-binding protein [Clostridium neonatale]CAI3705376.1 putative ABC amino acid transporter, substrate-binding protein [Clostridium neonatale]CAI3710702.1 putative ABC amino acid transporter, substrate-binding protein [Clostridium neonatale]CAI3713481.1 putative ABC amino acid transporter, substrate-binding protein [Clostridium neonatale]CAI3716080.1 putative ABC amino acid transporter, substrate-binding protein [Clostridium neonatale]
MNAKKLIKKIATLGIIGVLGTSLIACGGSSSQASSESSGKETEAKGTIEKKELVIGLDDIFVPMGFKDENGELVGFDVELAKVVCEKLGKEYKFQAIDWSMKETELNSGNIDLIWNGYSISDERKEKVDFSKPYLDNKQIIVTLADSSINKKADLEGKKVGAQNQSTAVDAVKADESNIIEKFDGGDLVTFENNNDALMDLEAGRLDAIVVDEILARYYIEARGSEKYKILDENFGDEQYGVGIRKGDTEFVDAFNKALDEVVADGTAGEISKKWFGEDIVVK